MPQSPSVEEYRVESLVGSKSLGSIRDLWQLWQAHPNADVDFFESVVESRPSVVNPMAIVLYFKEAPVAMAVGRLEKFILPATFGYLKIFNSELLQFTIVYGGLMGTWDEQGSATFVNYLRKWMQRDRVDAVYLAAMQCEQPVYRAAVRGVPFFLRHTPVKDNFHWWAELAETPELLKSKINKADRKKERKLAQHSGGEIELKIFQKPEDVPEFCSAAEKIIQTTYLRGLGVGFCDNEEMRKRLGVTSRKGWMNGFILYANNQPCAFQLGTLYQSVLYLDYTGFKSDLYPYSPGRILFIKMVDHLCRTQAVRGIDFGFGDAEFKRRYADRSWKESDLYLFNQTPTLLMANLVRNSVALFRGIAEKMLRHFDLHDQVKKWWRRSAEKTGQSTVQTEEEGAN